MIERRLFYLQTRLDSSPRGTGTRTGGPGEPHEHLGGRIHRLVTGQRRSPNAGAAR